MPRANHNDDDEYRIPTGVVVSIIGLIVMVTAVVIWLVLAGNRGFADLPPLLELARVPTETPVGNILLPESPVLNGDGTFTLPSQASVADAPRQLPITRRHQPTRLAIPSIGVSANIREVALVPVEQGGQLFYQWAVPSSIEAGWHNTSALLGDPGNTVINGHNNIYGAIFRDLVNMAVGDEIVLYDSEQAHFYQVSQVEVLPEQGQPVAVRLDNARWIEPTDDERVTLVSCWPYETNTHRVVVIAKPAAP